MTKKDLELKIEELQKIIIEKDRELEKLHDRIEQLEKSSGRKHNERNAGRKPADEKWVASFNRFSALYEAQKTMQEIMGETGMSRATYFRYKKLYDATSTTSIKN